MVVMSRYRMNWKIGKKTRGKKYLYTLLQTDEDRKKVHARETMTGEEEVMYVSSWSARAMAQGKVSCEHGCMD